MTNLTGVLTEGRACGNLAGHRAKAQLRGDLTGAMVDAACGNLSGATIEARTRGNLTSRCRVPGGGQ
jgi:hypothetical protein